MSEYQYIAFRAIDAPVSEKHLEFMRQQSSRAEITPWSFDNQYHFGEFHGNAQEMLRRGYDFHFHCANYGIRSLMIRLPDGLPDAKAAEPYFETNSLGFIKDEQGSGGILYFQPSYEPGTLNDLFEPETLVEHLVLLQSEILAGDLRPLYLGRLAYAMDINHDPETEKDAPVPAGLGKPTRAQSAMMELYGLSDVLVAAAARNAPPLPKRGNSESQYKAWLERQDEANKNAWLSQLLADPHATVRREILGEFQKSQSIPSWPTVCIDRTIAEIESASEGLQQEQDRQQAEEAAGRRAARFIAMAADPMATVQQVEELVKLRSSYNYHQAAQLLADLREMLSGTNRSDLAEQQARKLKESNPTLNHLTKELRSQGFLKK